MPRGAYGKRSGRATPGGPAVTSGFLAFPNEAAMAAYDTTALVNGAEAEVATYADTFLLDKSSALPPVHASVVNATGGGQWLRQAIPSLRWQARSGWYINAAAGDDEAAGTIGAPVRTFLELKRRLGPGPLVNCAITYIGDSAEDVLYDFDSPGNVEIGGIATTTFAGVVSAAQNANPATPVAANITAAALPVSWTASGLVHQIGVLTSGASNGLFFAVSADLGAKAARITQPASGSLPFATGPVANGDTFDMQDIVRLTGVWRIVSAPGKLYFGFLEMFATQVSAGDPGFKACILHQPFADGSGRPRFVGCAVEDASVTESAEIVGFASSFYQSTGASIAIGPLGQATLEETLVEGAGAGTWGILADDLVRVRILTYAAVYGAEDAIQMGVQSRLDSSQARLFGTGNTAHGIVLGADGELAYTPGAAFLPNVLNPTVQVDVAGMPKTYAQLPTLNMGNGAKAVSDAAAIAMVETFVPLAVDINTAVGIQPFAVVLTANITVDGTRDVEYAVCYGVFGLAGPTQGVIGLFIDGVQATTAPVYVPGGVIAMIVGGALRWKSQAGGAGVRARLAAGAHTITVQWAQAGAAAQMFCRPVTQAAQGESMSLTIREIVNDW
jgi:hypothetical protein